MKKILVTMFMLGIAGCLYAGQNVAILPSTDIPINTTIACSSTTATLVAPANSYRKGIMISNNDTYVVRVATFATTSNTAGQRILVGSSFSDNIEAYKGAWYVISVGPTATNSVDVIEKQGVIYQ